MPGDGRENRGPGGQDGLRVARSGLKQRTAPSGKKTGDDTEGMLTLWMG